MFSKLEVIKSGFWKVQSRLETAFTRAEQQVWRLLRKLVTRGEKNSVSKFGVNSLIFGLTFEFLHHFSGLVQLKGSFEQFLMFKGWDWGSNWRTIYSLNHLTIETLWKEISQQWLATIIEPIISTKLICTFRNFFVMVLTVQVEVVFLQYTLWLEKGTDHFYTAIWPV